MQARSLSATTQRQNIIGLIEITSTRSLFLYLLRGHAQALRSERLLYAGRAKPSEFLHIGFHAAAY
ncbi:hypothetical protein ACPOL_3647 [Acidisarcina polymorpha]|uniref:Uncharacterized protein n=1 Tax=Acidisarcina polymorpha TaxID=2211140 RepID=A0A2Z5G1M4_9BACT|nr:hypothetical protein ACPOL_3647 [Acidisarcina polymorpha]